MRANQKADAHISIERPVKRSAVLFLILMLFIGTLAIFCRAATYGFVNYDDSEYVYNNAILHHASLLTQLHWAMTALVPSNYHPVTLLAEVLIARTFGTSASGFHACSIGLHACNVTLLFYLLLTTTRRVLFAVLTAIFWGWHPLRVESVAWVSELKDPLSTFFWLLSLLAFAQYSRTRRPIIYWAMVATAVLACASKPMAVTLPVTMLLFNVWPLRRTSQKLSSSIVEVLPVLLVVCIFSVATWYAQRSLAQHLDVISLASRTKNAVLSMGLYITTSFIPVNLAVFYPHPVLLHQMISKWWIASAVCLTCLSGAAWFARRRMPVLFFGWYWYILTLAPVIGIIQVGEQSHADRYTYVPTIGLTVLVIAILDLIIRRLDRGFAIASVLTVVAIIAVSMVSVTEVQLSYWENSRTLFQRALDVTNGNHLAMDVLAEEDLQSGQTDRALQLAREAYHLRPGASFSNIVLAEVYDQAGNHGKAAAAYSRVVKLIPNDAVQQSNLGAELEKTGNSSEAERRYREAIRLDPRLATAHANLGILLAARNDVDGAIVQWRIAVSLDRSLSNTFASLARAEAMAGDDDAALTDYRAAIDHSSAPTGEWLLSAAWLAATSPQSTDVQIETAVSDARRGIAILGTKAQTDPIAYDNLGAALARQGRFDDAVVAARTALRAHPSEHLAKMIRERLDGYTAGRAYVR